MNFRIPALWIVAAIALGGSVAAWWWASRVPREDASALSLAQMAAFALTGWLIACAVTESAMSAWAPPLDGVSRYRRRAVLWCVAAAACAIGLGVVMQLAAGVAPPLALMPGVGAGLYCVGMARRQWHLHRNRVVN